LTDILTLILCWQGWRHPKIKSIYKVHRYHKDNTPWGNFYCADEQQPLRYGGAGGNGWNSIPYDPLGRCLSWKGEAVSDILGYCEEWTPAPAQECVKFKQGWTPAQKREMVESKVNCEFGDCGSLDDSALVGRCGIPDGFMQVDLQEFAFNEITPVQSCAEGAFNFLRCFSYAIADLKSNLLYSKMHAAADLKSHDLSKIPYLSKVIQSYSNPYALPEAPWFFPFGAGVLHYPQAYNLNVTIPNLIERP